jgi:hypothetical protein
MTEFSIAEEIDKKFDVFIENKERKSKETYEDLLSVLSNFDR